MTKSRGIIKPRTVWTPQMDASLAQKYPDGNNQALANELGVSIARMQSRASKLGIKKSKKYMQTLAANSNLKAVGSAYRFKKGSVPPNKGHKGVCHPASIPTQFKPGAKPFNYKPLGAIRLCSKDGYLLIKIAEGINQWKLLHRLIWERMNGKIPHGHVVTFIDGNKHNVKVTNLKLITQKQLALNNSVHNLPADLVKNIQLRAALNRRINHVTKKQL